MQHGSSGYHLIREAQVDLRESLAVGLVKVWAVSLSTRRLECVGDIQYCSFAQNDADEEQQQEEEEEEEDCRLSKSSSSQRLAVVVDGGGRYPFRYKLFVMYT